MTPPRRMEFVLLAALVALWTVLAVKTASPATDPTAELQRAGDAYRAGQFAPALAAARRASTMAPSSVRALLTHGRLGEYLGEFDEAEAVYAKAGAVAPNDPEVLLAIASFSIRLGEHNRALTLLDRVIAVQRWWIRWPFHYAPAFAQPLFLQSNGLTDQIVQLKIDLLMEENRLDSARQLARQYHIVQSGRDYCGEARQLREDSARERIFATFRLAALGQPDAADCIWWYGQWLTDEGFVRLGRLMVMEGTRATPSPANKASGERYLRVRLSRGREIPKRVEQLTLIGRQRYIRDGDPDAAVRLLQEAIQRDPEFPRPYHHLARIGWGTGDRMAAIGWLEQAVRVDPDSWLSHRNLGEALAELRRYADAEARLRRTVELFEDDTGGRLLLARVLYAQGKYDEYAQQTKHAIRFAEAYRAGSTVADVKEFLADFRRSGPGRFLLPATDPHVLIGWNNYD